MIFLIICVRFVKYSGKLVVVGDPCGLHTIEINEHDVSRLQGERPNENPSMFSKVMAVLFWKYLKIQKFS